MDTRTPRFISFEGGEGAGKSTQIKLLSEWLIGQGIDVVVTREPGGSPGAEVIRDLLVKGETDRWTPMCEALLMTAARAEHVERTIRPALEAYRWVLCDRFFDSTVAYQGAARGLGMDRMRELQSAALYGLAPDLTFIIDLPVNVGLSRAVGREVRKEDQADREDRFEKMNIAFHENIRTAFLKIAEDEPERCSVVDGDTDIATLQAMIKHIVRDRFLVGQ